MELHKGEWIMINKKLCYIDEECVDWVLLFNKIGLTTKFCCHGNDEVLDYYEIVFHEDVTDNQIYEFMQKHPKIWGFYKWTRTGYCNDTLYHNWMFSPKTKRNAKELFEQLCQYEDIKIIVENKLR